MSRVCMGLAVCARTDLAIRAGDAAENTMANHQARPTAPFAWQAGCDINLAEAGRIAGRAE